MSTAPILTSVLFQPADINGVPLQGATLAFFAAGTTSAITVYQDAGLVTPFGSTVTADAAGRFPPIYLAPAFIKTVLKDVNAVLIQTIDNITVGSADGTLILKQSTNPAPTAEGDIEWDTDNDRIAVGNGGGTSTFSNDASNAATYLSNSSVATAAQYWANTPSKVLGTATVWTGAVSTPVTYSGTVTLDFSTGLNFSLVLTGNVILANPTNIKEGQQGRIRVTQDGSGNRLISSWGTFWKSVNAQKPVLSQSANAQDTLYYDAETTTQIVVSMGRNIS